jgi:thiamine-phosphate pyrophosphorylase
MDATIRILDANLNRAREGLRTCEEFARYALQDARATEAIKRARRALQACHDQLGPVAERLLLSRDVTSDTGAQPGGDNGLREDLAGVAKAGIKRAQEALRVIEESCRLVAPEAGAHAAGARYAAYEAEQQVFAAGPRRATLRNEPVMIVFTRALCSRPWQETLDLLLAGGARLFQLREKDVPGRDYAAFARKFIERARPMGAKVIVNDRADIAAAIEADGLHLGQDDLTFTDARRVVGPTAVIGISTHSVSEAEEAEAAGADYLGLGSMFPTGTKNVSSIGGPDLARDVVPQVSVPVFAIGGVNVLNAANLRSRGIQKVAVARAVLAAQDPAAAYAAIAAALGAK